MTAEAIDQRRLDFSKLKHCGRDSELQELHHLLEGATSADGAETVAVLMHGDSGTGKSALLANFLDVASHCWVLRGKFEERAAASEPFAALMEAIDDLVQYMIAEDRDVWAERLRKALDTELELICGILTCLRFLFSSGTSSNKDEVTSQQEDFIEDDSVNSDPFGDMTRREFRFERFKFAFRCLLRCVCTHKPVVLALDDFHSVDPDSLEILKTLLSDSKRKSNFLFVGASRPMADYESLRSFSESLSKERLRLAVISGLSLSDISSLLNDLLQRDGDSVRQLAEVIESKTNGNAFVVLQFLRMLERDCHIFFSGDSLRWEWDIDTILQVENISESVTEVLTQNLERVDKRRKSALMVAASLGTSQFDVSTIVHAASVLEDEGDAACTDSLDTDRMDPITVRQTIEQMNADLTEAEKDGFVQMIEKGSFRFAHDRIRESAYSLIPDGNGREEVHLRVGRQLRSWMDTGSELGLVQGFSEQSLLLHAAKQLNLGSAMIVDDWEKLDLVELNYRAAELSAEKASFYTSMEYLKKGLAHLGKSAWKSHYDWTLKLCVALTRMQYSCGLVEQCMETADDVIENGNSFRDKRAVYHTKIFCLIQQQRMKEATNLGKPVP